MEKQTAGRDNLGKLAPKFAELNLILQWEKHMELRKQK